VVAFLLHIAASVPSALVAIFSSGTSSPGRNGQQQALWLCHALAAQIILNNVKLACKTFLKFLNSILQIFFEEMGQTKLL